ncbi:MAG: hypothetical protein LUB59_05520 [Candidatus Gastranaerophilales bacterium]|nr:hypothetical protein [Candidatus Gastranaerophilales bacterium]
MNTWKSIVTELNKESRLLSDHINSRYEGILYDIHRVKDAVKDLSSAVDTQLTEANRTISDLRSYIDILLQFITEKYDKGTIIIYDEHDPHSIQIIKDGKRVDTSRVKHITFYYDADEFPTLEIEQ